MLNFGQSVHGIFAKLILLLLVGTFVLWGIGDIFRQGGGPSNVATVGRTPISVQAYMQALRRKQEELRQQMGKSYTPDALKAYHVQEQTLMALINKTLIEKETEALGIVVGDDEIRDAIRNNPAFADRNGHFDKVLYEERLKDQGIAEQRYVADQRQSMAATLLFEAISPDIVVPETLVQAIYKSRDEQRVADMIVIPAGAAGQEAAPTDKDIQAYYDAHGKEYTAPERRTVSYVMLKLADIAAKIDVPQDDVKHAYDDRIADFHVAEGRDVEQLNFDNENAAKKAAGELAGGKSFADVAKSSPILNKGKLSMGTVTPQDVPPDVAKAIFDLKDNGNTAPIKTDFGWNIFHVNKKVPESTKPFEAVRADIAKDLAARQAQETVYKLVNDLEDTLAGGSTLENAAQKIGQKVNTLGPVTREEAGKQKLPDNFVNVAFTTGDKDHSPATQTADGSYFLVHVDNVEPEHERPLAEVKNEIIAALKKENHTQQLQKLAEDVSLQLRDGKKLTDVLASHHLSIAPVSTGKLKRDSETATSGAYAGKPLPRSMVIELFHLKQGQSTHAYPMSNGDSVVASLSQVIAAPDATSKNADAKMLQAIRNELKYEMLNEMQQHYVATLSNKYKVSVNESALGVNVDPGSD